MEPEQIDVPQPEPIEDKQPEKKKRLTAKRRSATNFSNFIQANRSGIVQVTPAVKYTLRDVIEENYTDRAMTFSVPYYADGQERIFFSLPYIIADAVYRNTNIDTKNIQVKSDTQGAIEWIQLIRGAVDNYLKTTYYGKEINLFRRELIDMGHLIVKEVDNKTHIVNLLNIVRPAHIKDLQKGGLAERTLLTWTDMLANKEIWKKEWRQVTRLKDILDTMQKKSFIVYEWWTIDQFEVNGEMKETKGCIKYMDCSPYDEMVADDPANWFPYVELERFACPDEEKVRSKKLLKGLIDSGYLSKGATTQPIYPYEEQSLIEVAGRWMGMGFYELLRPEKKAYVKTLNEKLRYDEMLHKGVLVHTKAPFSSNQKGSGRSIESEIISRIQTGTMISIKAGESIERLNIGSLTADFIASADKWFEIARRKSGVSEITAGEGQPGNQAASTSILQQNQGKTTFDIVNEQQGLFLEKLFTRFKLSSILNELAEEDWTKIAGDPETLQKMEEPFIENFVHQGIINAAQMGMISPNASSLPQGEIDNLKMAVTAARAKHGGERPIQISKEMINNFDWYARFYVTSENFDKQQTLMAIQDAINTVAQNPMAIDVDLSKLIEQKMDIMGVNPVPLRKSPEKIKQDQMAAMQAADAVNNANPAKAGMPQPPAKAFGEANAR